MKVPQHALISVVLPAYNECEGVPLVIKAVLATLSDPALSVEIIVVDDGSTDLTRHAILELIERETPVRYVRLSRNFGKEAAISAGLKAASGDAVILMDSDGQHPVSMLPRFIERWRAGIEVVAGVQVTRAEQPLKKVFKRGYYWLLEAGSPVVVPPNAGDFRLMDRKVVDAINTLPERGRLMKGIYAWVGFTTELIPFNAEPRVAGETKYSWSRLFGLAFTGLTSFTVVPLRLVSVSGVIVSIAAIVYGCYLMFEHFVWKDNVPGWATLSVGMMFLSGVQLLALGVIAEYLGRALEEAKQRPLYILAEDTGAVRPASTVIDTRSNTAFGNPGIA